MRSARFDAAEARPVGFRRYAGWVVTHTRKYAPGPCLLDLEIVESAVQISVRPTRNGSGSTLESLWR
ncbi:hypothetical protein [Streptomyces sp. SLBN-8D4]|jgi:hypothetical protein|uniref:hypothetical protein n=1 Tax=Streptomyces sp. SLBN-8D4 TaxID=3377728 RepID=UPI003C7B0C5C